MSELQEKIGALLADERKRQNRSLENLAVELVRQRESLTLDVTAPGSPWSRAWKCRTEDDADGERKRCESKDGRSYSFRFSVDDDE